MSNKKKTILIVALLLVVFIGSISYALWSVTLEQTDSNIVKTGCFETTMLEETVCSGCENLTEVIIPINVYNLMHGNIQDLIWGDTRYVPEGAKYIMPIKLSEYGEKYKIYSLMSTGYEELGAVTTINN